MPVGVRYPGRPVETVEAPIGTPLRYSRARCDFRLTISSIGPAGATLGAQAYCPDFNASTLRTIDPPDVNLLGIEEPLELPDEIPVGPRSAAEEIQAERAVLREGVAGEVRLRKHVDAGDAA